MVWLFDKWVEPKSLMTDGGIMEMSFQGWKRLKPHARNFFKDFGCEELFENHTDIKNTQPDVIYRKKTAEETDAELNARVKMYENFEPYLYQRLMKTVPDIFITELDKHRNGLAAWVALRTHLTEKNHTFISTTQDRLKSMRLTHYKNNMRLLLNDFAEDLEALKGFENLSMTSILKYLRRSQAIYPDDPIKGVWNSSDPYHEPLSKLYDKVMTGKSLNFEKIRIALEQHYDLVFKSTVERIHMSHTVKPKFSAAVATHNADDGSKSLTAAELLVTAANTPGVSKNQQKKIQSCQAFLSSGKGGKGAKGDRNHKSLHFPFKKPGKGGGKGKGNRKGKGAGKGGGYANRKILKCNNCHKDGHTVDRCWAPGGGAHDPNYYKKKKSQNDEADDEANVSHHVFVSKYMENLLVSDDKTTYDEDWVYIDTCATSHMAGSDNGVSKKEEAEGIVQYGDPLSSSNVTHKCVKSVQIKDQKGKTHKISLKNTIFVPGLSKNIWSVYQLEKSGIKVINEKDNRRLVLPKTDDSPPVYIPIEWHNRMMAMKIQPF